MTEARARLAEIFQVVFDLPTDADLSRLVPGSDAWDSLGHVSLVTAISSEFDVQISAIDSLEITSFDATLELLEELLNE